MQDFGSGDTSSNLVGGILTKKKDLIVTRRFSVSFRYISSPDNSLAYLRHRTHEGIIAEDNKSAAAQVTL